MNTHGMNQNVRKIDKHQIKNTNSKPTPSNTHTYWGYTILNISKLKKNNQNQKIVTVPNLLKKVVGV